MQQWYICKTMLGIKFSTDHLKIWTINIDWENPNNSSISYPYQLPTSSFTSVFDGGSFANLTQSSGPDIDAMQAIVNESSSI